MNWKRSSRWILAALAIFVGWLTVMALVMVLSDAAPGAVVILPTEDFTANLAPDVAIAAGGPLWLIVKGDGPGLGLSLYRAGGRLVLPAGLPGCIPLPGA